MLCLTDHAGTDVLAKSCFSRLNDGCCHLVRIRVRRWSTIFEATFPAVFDGSNRNSDGCTAVRHTVAELVDPLCFHADRSDAVRCQHRRHRYVEELPHRNPRKSCERVLLRRQSASHRWRSWRACRNRSSRLDQAALGAS